MDKINCRVISVRDTDNVKYNTRNKIVDDFISSENDNFYSKVSEAVKPTDWKIIDSKVIYNDEVFTTCDRLAHSHGITNYLSHYKIWKELGGFLILEDDIIYDLNLLNKLPYLIEKFNEIDIPNKILYLQSSCPWRQNFPDKEYQYLYDYSKDFYLLNNKVFNDVSGTAAYYMNVDSNFLNLLKKEIGSTDGILDNLLKSNNLFYFIPRDFNNWFKLNKDVQ